MLKFYTVFPYQKKVGYMGQINGGKKNPQLYSDLIYCFIVEIVFFFFFA